MSKLPLNNVSSLTSEASAIATINDNSAAITAAFDNTLSRDGTAPNTMSAPIDMNSHSLLNIGPLNMNNNALTGLPAPVNPTDAARLADIGSGSGGSSGVSSFNSRTGIVVPVSGDYTFAQIGTTPTTIAGYGLTDAAPLASPALTGSPTAPTASPLTNSTRLATTAYADAAVVAERTATTSISHKTISLSNVANVYNARFYGAAPGNTASANTTAFAAAVTAAAATQGTVYIPAGSYAGNIVVQDILGLSIMGDGEGTFITAAVNVNALDIFSNSGSGGVNNISVSNLILSASGTGIGVRVWNCLHWDLTDVQTVGTGPGFSIQGSGNGRILNCQGTGYPALAIGNGLDAITNSGPIAIVAGQYTAFGGGAPAIQIQGDPLGVTFTNVMYEMNGGTTTAAITIDGMITPYATGIAGNVSFVGCHGESNYNTVGTGADFEIGKTHKFGSVSILGHSAFGHGDGTHPLQDMVRVYAAINVSVRDTIGWRFTATTGYSRSIIRLETTFPAAGDTYRFENIINDGSGSLYSDANGVLTGTNDASNRPIINATLVSPALTGVPTAPTATVGTNTTQVASTAFVLANATGTISPATVAPLIDGTAAVGTSLLYARQDHVHPTDTTRVPLNGALGTPTSGTATNLTGTASGLTAGSVTTNANLTGDVTSSGNATTLTNAPVIAKVLTGFTAGAGTVASTDSILTAFQKHDGNITLKAPLASPALTGTPTAPTASALTNTTQLATTAYADAATSTLSGTVTTALALKAPLASPTLTGVPAAPTAAVDTNTTQLATTAMVLAQAASATPLINGTATVGTSTRFARGDHIHPTDTTRAPLASPALTGVPTSPTAALQNNSTQLATTAYVDTSTRQKLTTAVTYYVRTDGSDSNTGLVNSAGGAFLTIQKAYNVIAGTLDLGGNTVTIQIVDGTYTAGLTISQPWTGGGSVVVLGNTTTPANVLLSFTGSGITNSTSLPGVLTVKGMKFTLTSGTGIKNAGFGNITFQNIDFGSCTVHIGCSQPGASITASGPYTISGNAIYHAISNAPGAYIQVNVVTVTLTGTPAFSGVFANANLAGVVDLQSVTYTGSATGTRYSSTQNGLVLTNGGGATYLPGNAAGSIATQGQYL